MLGMTPLELVAQTTQPSRLRTTAADRLRSALRAGDPQMHFQPVLDLCSGQLVGWEALSRFPHLLGRRPDQVFALAHEIGIGPELEVAALLRALDETRDLRPDRVVSVNLSPSTLTSRQLMLALPLDLNGVLIEVTEHEQVLDMAELVGALSALRQRGARVAVDDVGEGYAGLQQVMAMAPDTLKLDRSLISGVHTNPAKAALVRAIVSYANQTGAEVCAEGVEEPGELALLADLDVSYAQGWLVGRPAPEPCDVEPEAREVWAAAAHRAVTVGTLEDAGDLVPVVARIAESGSLAELARALATIAPRLSASHIELSYVSADGSFVEALLADDGSFKGIHYALADYPLTERVLRTDEAAQVVLGTRDADRAESAWMREDGVGALLMVPVRAGGRVVGLLECHQARTRPFRRRQVRAARMVAAVAGPVLVALLPDPPGHSSR